MPKKKIERMDIFCMSCKEPILDALMTEGTEIKCPQCGFVFILNIENMTELAREVVTRVHEKFNSSPKA